MTRARWIKAGALAAGCAAVGAVAGIAGGAASPTTTGGKSAAGAPHWRMHRAIGGPPIHSEVVVPKRSGNGFETLTGDNGKLKSRSGDDLTITEGTRSEKYKDTTLTIPSGATIVRNGKKASLDDLKDGDSVHVMQSPERTVVIAGDKTFRPRFGHRRRDFRGGPPPGAPGPPPPPPYGP